MTHDPRQAWLAETHAHGDIAAWLDAIPYARRLGIEPVGSGSAPLYRLAPKPENIGNPLLPALHGGVVAAFMETAGLLELMRVGESPRLPKLIDFAIDYLRSARVVPTLARCEITREGRRLANVSVVAWQEDEARPVARARLHALLVSPEG
ncbi:PaaI family thioesterase [Halomonas pacifica]|uniref:PaaI family thioesterase n=1 Tax=Bisbaumannia pacifica TaxID=77098 RepID=A0ABD4L2T7_9GAMM|nr:PaaI family thioesterase [Halomonas pacifica]MBH8580276.1 PaaI family thioesterase [Halomonas pacifica]MDC8803308.1 PaaI family thioesterase [Halomonas pacifica]